MTEVGSHISTGAVDTAVEMAIKLMGDEQKVPPSKVASALSLEYGSSLRVARSLVSKAVLSGRLKLTSEGDFLQLSRVSLQPSHLLAREEPQVFVEGSTYEPTLTFRGKAAKDETIGSPVADFESNTPREAASWDETFMRMALVVADRSKDPSTQVGACIVSSEFRILSLGYNGTPNGWQDGDFPWAKAAEDPLDTKYPYVIHAERNAVLNYAGARRELHGAKVYVSHFPCNECAKELAQVGVSEVIYLNNHDSSDFSTQASLRILEQCGVTVRQMDLL